MAINMESEISLQVELFSDFLFRELEVF